MIRNGKPFLFNISGPYAVGKDTILNEILSVYPTLVHRVRTLTTRPVSQEADPSYEGVSFEELERRTAQGRWIVNYQISGMVAYATSVDEIEEKGHAGFVCIHSIFAGSDGAGKLREIFGRKAFSVGLLPASGGVMAQLAVLRARLLGRGRDDPSAVEGRLQHQVQPLEYAIENPIVMTPDGMMNVFNRKLINEELESTIRDINHLFNITFIEGR